MVQHAGPTRLDIGAMQLDVGKLGQIECFERTCFAYKRLNSHKSRIVAYII
jgi:hypothetical protein